MGENKGHPNHNPGAQTPRQWGTGGLIRINNFRLIAWVELDSTGRGVELLASQVTSYSSSRACVRAGWTGQGGIRTAEAPIVSAQMLTLTFGYLGFPERVYSLLVSQLA